MVFCQQSQLGTPDWIRATRTQFARFGCGFCKFQVNKSHSFCHRKLRGLAFNFSGQLKNYLKMQNLDRLLSGASLTILLCCTAAGQETPKTGDTDCDLVLWNAKPATNWLDAMPIGNGRLGAMVFGGVAEERLALNEDTLYANEPDGQDLPLDITKDFSTITNLILTGQNGEADYQVTKNGLAALCLVTNRWATCC